MPSYREVFGDFGVAAYISKTGQPCVYCGEESVQTFSPGRARGAVLETRVGLCAVHAREPEPPLGPAPPAKSEQIKFDI